LIRAPIGQGRLLLPSGSRRDAAAGLALLAPNRRAALLAAGAYLAALKVLGPRRAGRAVHGEVQEMGVVDAGLVALLVDRLGPLSGLAMIDPRQSHRPRAALLAVRHGVPVAFVKVNALPEELERERLALDHLAAAPVSCRIPRVLDAGRWGEVSWMATSAMTSGWTTPVTELPVGWRTGQEFGSLVELLGPRPAPEAVALHGDLTPWNLRRCAGDTWLLDWEDACWGPSGADEAYFHATATAVCGAPLRSTSSELAAFWQERIRQRPASGAEVRFRERLLDVLRRMAAG
jgi:hypothetical protein